MNFEEKKREIVDFVVNGLIDSNGGKDVGVMVVKFNQMMDKLKPDYPTCSTCGYCNKVTKFGHVELYCEHPMVNNDPAQEDFGCNKHSELESKNEI